MNEKVGYLNVFFRQEKSALPIAVAKEIAQYLPALVFLYNSESRSVEYGNQRFSQYTAELLESLSSSGENILAAIHPDDAEDASRLLDPGQYPADTGQLTVALRMADAGAVYRSFRVEARVIRPNDDSEVKHILFVAHDMTQQLKSKQEIETTRELLEETEELLQFGSWAWEIATNTVSWTAGLYSLLEYDRKDVEDRVGLSFYLSHVLEEYNQPFQEMLQHALEEKSDFSFEYVVRTNTGLLKNVSTRGKLVKDENGEVVKMLCINRDITPIRNFEKEQERNMRELNRSNKDLEEFAYIASHDLQEPLRKISMFTERLRAKFDDTLDQESELFIERILASANNMRTLIDNLLDFSRANRRSAPFDQVELRTVFDAVISELELKIEETQAEIVFSGDLPTIEAVPSEMTQLFGNVLSNAIKFRREDTSTRITIGASRVAKNEKNALRLPAGQAFHKIEVTDNGIGFEPEYSEKIFQIFQRLNGKSEYPGSGIGLAICKKIVEKHNGLIFAASQLEKGATFTIILPEKQF